MNRNFKKTWIPQTEWVPQIVSIKTMKDPRGNLGIVEALPDAGFIFKRLYFIYGVTDGTTRGQHAHKDLWQYMIAMNGSFGITLKGGGKTFDFTLSSPQEALLIPPGYWRDLNGFSPDAVCLVAASEEYDEKDYIRDYDEFLRWETGR